jgi:hypothetical protein
MASSSRIFVLLWEATPGVLEEILSILRSRALFRKTVFVVPPERASWFEENALARYELIRHKILEGSGVKFPELRRGGMIISHQGWYPFVSINRRSDLRAILLSVPENESDQASSHQDMTTKGSAQGTGVMNHLSTYTLQDIQYKITVRGLIGEKKD